MNDIKANTILKAKKRTVKNHKVDYIRKEFGNEIGDIFTEALGDIKIEAEAKRLKAEGIDIDNLSCDEFKKRYRKWTRYKLNCLRSK